jgi:hypothetical protein
LTYIANGGRRCFSAEKNNIKYTAYFPAEKTQHSEEYLLFFLEAAMENKGYFTIPEILFESSTFFARVLPVRSGPRRSLN